jgi:ketosteroid isomerase-like protein
MTSQSPSEAKAEEALGEHGEEDEPADKTACTIEHRAAAQGPTTALDEKR